MTILAATVLVALAAAANVFLVVALADTFGAEGRATDIVGAVPTAA